MPFSDIQLDTFVPRWMAPKNPVPAIHKSSILGDMAESEVTPQERSVREAEFSHTVVVHTRKTCRICCRRLFWQPAQSPAR